MRRILALVVLSLCLILEVATAQEEDYQSVIRDIKGKIDSLKSYKAKIEMVFLQSGGEVMELEGEIEYVKPDKLKMVIGVKGEDKTKQYIYSDGSTLWQYMPFFKLASKVDLAALKAEFPNVDDLIKGQSNVETTLKDFKEEGIRYLGIEDLEGERTYVFEGEIKEDKKQEMDLPMEVARLKVWISVDDGLQRKAEFYSEGGQLLFYQKLKDVQVNIDIPDDEFKFQKPDDVNVLDSTPQARQLLKEKQEEKEEVPES